MRSTENWIIFLIGVLLGLYALGIYVEAQRPTFELKKDDWACTKKITRTHLESRDGRLIPVTKTHCIRYEPTGE